MVKSTRIDYLIKQDRKPSVQSNDPCPPTKHYPAHNELVFFKIFLIEGLLEDSRFSCVHFATIDLLTGSMSSTVVASSCRTLSHISRSAWLLTYSGSVERLPCFINSSFLLITITLIQI